MPFSFRCPLKHADWPIYIPKALHCHREKGNENEMAGKTHWAGKQVFLASSCVGAQGEETRQEWKRK